MKYVMMICDAPRADSTLSQEEMKAVYQEIWAHVEKWEKLGRYVEGGAELQGRETARTVRRNSSGGVVVMDGPYTEIKEQIGGFMIIEADSLEDALETAQEWPGIKYGSSIEVRPAVRHER